MKFSEKVCFEIILRYILEDTFFEKPEEGGVGVNLTPLFPQAY